MGLGISPAINYLIKPMFTLSPNQLKSAANIAEH